MIDSDLMTWLAANGNLAAQFGTRIYAGAVPLGTTTPYLTFELISNPGDYDMAGVDPLSQARYQFNVVGGTALERSAAAAALDTELDDFAGSMGGVVIAEVSRDNVGHRRDIIDGDQVRWLAFLDYLITYEV